MTLSESEEIETNPIFNAVFVQANENIRNIFPDDNSRRFYGSLLTGGKTAANAVIAGCQGLMEICGEIDRAKALALTKLFTLLMLSQAFCWLENQGMEAEETEEAEEVMKSNLTAASVVLSLFGDSSEGSIKDFLIIDTQFRYELKHHDHLTHLAVLLLAKACEACGHRCIEWSKVKFPMKSLQSLTTSGAIVDALRINSVNDIRVVINSFAAGVQAMVNYHEEHTEA